MKIAIIGYGRMGRLIEQTALRRGHTIACRIDRDNTADYDSEAFRSADVAIEFSTPDTAVDGILHSFAAGIPVVCGTTGWGDSLPEIRSMAEGGRGAIIHASNFSIGMNMFMAVNRYLARMMNRFPGYTPRISETHHIHKLDHPSGTAITLAEDLIAQYPDLCSWKECESPAEPSVLPISCERRGEVPGIHTVEWDSQADTITITHSAKNREGFALGAVMAAEWIRGRKPGFYSMADMLGLD